MSDPENLDVLITGVARRMTDRGTPPMRARVMARLDERRAARPWLLPAGAFAAAACAAVVFVMTRPAIESHDAGVSGLGARGSALARTETRMPNTATRSPRAEPRGPNPEPRMPSAETRGPSPDQLAWQAAAIPALDRPELLTLEDIQPEQLEVRPLDVAPLEIPAIGAEE